MIISHINNNNIGWVRVAGISKPSYGTLAPKTRLFRILKFHVSADNFNFDYNPQKVIISCLSCCKFTEVEKFISALCCRPAAKMWPILDEKCPILSNQTTTYHIVQKTGQNSFFFLSTSWELLTFPKLGRQWEISFSVILFLHRGTFHISFTWILRGNTSFLVGISLECDVFVENFNISFIGSLGAFLHTPKCFSFYYWPQLHDLACFFRHCPSTWQVSFISSILS